MPCAEGICTPDLPVSLGTARGVAGGLFDSSGSEAVSPGPRLALPWLRA